MAVRLSDLPALSAAEPSLALGNTHQFAGMNARRLALRGQLLLERASSLEGVRAGGRGIPGIPGVPLHIVGHECRNVANTFIRDRVFAVLDDDGSLCLRLPTDIADDLVENGLGMRSGKNLLTWPVDSEHQLEVSWRILLHVYWHVTDSPASQTRRLWSEWVIQR